MMAKKGRLPPGCSLRSAEAISRLRPSRSTSATERSDQTSSALGSAPAVVSAVAGRRAVRDQLGGDPDAAVDLRAAVFHPASHVEDGLAARRVVEAAHHAGRHHLRARSEAQPACRRVGPGRRGHDRNHQRRAEQSGEDAGKHRCRRAPPVAGARRSGGSGRSRGLGHLRGRRGSCGLGHLRPAPPRVRVAVCRRRGRTSRPRAGAVRSARDGLRRVPLFLGRVVVLRVLLRRRRRGRRRNSRGLAVWRNRGRDRRRPPPASRTGFVTCAESETGASGASPVSSAIPNRSSASRRRAALSRCGQTSVLPERVTTRDALRQPHRDAPLPTGDAASEVTNPGWCPAAAGSASAPGRRAWKTFLHDEQRTRTPLSVTFSPAMRNFDRQDGHWTTTRAFSRVGRLGDKEMSRREGVSRAP